MLHHQASTPARPKLEKENLESVYDDFCSVAVGVGESKEPLGAKYSNVSGRGTFGYQLAQKFVKRFGARGKKRRMVKACGSVEHRSRWG